MKFEESTLVGDWALPVVLCASAGFYWVETATDRTYIGAYAGSSWMYRPNNVPMP